MSEQITFYPGNIFNRVIRGNACNLPAKDVSAMPFNTNSIYQVSAREKGKPLDTISQVMVSRYDPLIMAHEQIWMKEALRIVPEDNQEIVMEAIVFDVPIMRLATAGLLDKLNDDEVLVGFNIQAKRDGKHHPAMRADKFIPWALEILEATRKVNYILADYEVGSDTLRQFMKNYHMPANPNAETVTEAKIQAMHSTWGHKQLSKAGYDLVPGDNIKFIFSKEKNKLAYINALYTKIKK